MNLGGLSAASPKFSLGSKMKEKCSGQKFPKALQLKLWSMG